ncbi:MAG: hypothetical protein ACRC5A_03275 [Enterobacteriaceae bacterium]
MFPSGQLVTSPAQEEAKMNYLKEQRIERTLTSMDGVISAQVMIAQSAPDMDNPSGSVKSASVFIKYSPQSSIDNSENQIKHLVENSVPELSYDHITVFMQPSNYHYEPVNTVHNSDKSLSDTFLRKVKNHKLLILAVLIGLVISIFSALVVINRK